jgi:glycerol-3-phosphate acyltransferase PlsY
VLTLALAVLVIWKHRGNLARLAAGTELRAGRAKPG